MKTRIKKALRSKLDVNIKELVVDLANQAESTNAELEKLIAGTMNVYGELGFVMDQDGYTSVDALSMVEEIAENHEAFDKMFRKAEAGLAELRDAVAWYFETRSIPLFKRIPSKRFKGLFSCEDAMSEFGAIRRHAEKQLREMIGGEDGTTQNS